MMIALKVSREMLRNGMRSEANCRLFILLCLVLRLVRPHHHGVPGTRHAVRKLHGGLVTPLRVAILLLVALARSMVLPQGTTGEVSSAAFEINLSPRRTLMLH